MCFVRNAETELYVPSVANSSWWFGHEPDEASSSLGGGGDFSSWDVESKDPGELGQDFKDTERRPVPHYSRFSCIHDTKSDTTIPKTDLSYLQYFSVDLHSTMKREHNGNIALVGRG